MCDNLHLDSLQQCETPLNTLFFSDFNKNLIQRGVRQTFKNKSGIAIDYQNPDDMYAIMRVVFINNAGDDPDRCRHGCQRKEQDAHSRLGSGGVLPVRVRAFYFGVSAAG